jgi:hypothetical protein
VLSAPHQSRPTILVLSADPTNLGSVRVDEEIRAIENAVRKSTDRRVFDFLSLPRVVATELAELIRVYEPRILHFVGHGDEQGRLQFMGPNGRAEPADIDAIATVFRALADIVRCVVLNTCYSDQQAQKIAEHIDIVIGIPDTIEPAAAIEFAREFYLALASGRSVSDAFESGKANLELGGHVEAPAPVLYLRDGVDAKRMVLSRLGLPTSIIASELLESAMASIVTQGELAGTAQRVGDYKVAEATRRAAYEHAEQVLNASPSAETESLLIQAEFHYASILLTVAKVDDGATHLLAIADRAIAQSELLTGAQAASLVAILAQLGYPAKSRELFAVANLESDELELLLNIAESKLPDSLPEQPFLRVQIAFAHERRGEFCEAAEIARELDSIVLADRANACLLLGRAIHMTAVQVDSAKTYIESSDRGKAIARFTDLIAELRDEPGELPPGIRMVVDQIALSVEDSTFDRHGLERSLRRLGELEWQPSGGTPLELSWLGDYEALMGLIGEHRFENAACLAREISARHPDVCLFHWWVAKAVPTAEDALEHAERAYALLPGVGQAGLLAQLLMNNQRQREAWGVLESFLPRHSTYPALLRTAAWSLRISDPQRSADYFARFVAAHAEPGIADLVAYAEVLVQLNRREHFLVITDQALNNSTDVWTAPTLGNLAGLLLAQEPRDEQIVARLRLVHGLLGSACAPNSAVEVARMQIFHALGNPEDLATPDYERLIEAGLLTTASLQNVTEQVRAWNEKQRNIRTAWRAGLIPFSLFQRQAQLESAHLLYRVLHRPADDGPPLIPPFNTPFQEDSSIKLDGQHILLSELEITLLLKLRVWDSLLAQLGDEGKILLFDENWEQRIRGAAARIRQAAQPMARERQARLIRELHRWPKIRATSAQDTDPPVAITGEYDDTGDASVHDLIEVMTREGWLSERAPERDSSRSHRRLDHTPASLSLDYAAVTYLWNADLLESILEYAQIEQLIINAEVRSQLEGRLADLEEPALAAAAADAVQSAVLAAQGAGKLELIPHPRANVEREFPPEAVGEWADLRQVALAAMHWRWVLVHDPRAWLLSADHVTAAGSLRINLGFEQLLAWDSPDHLRATMKRYFAATSRVLQFAELVEQLAPEARKFKVATQLVRLGLPGALRPHHIVTLARQHHGLSRPYARQLLDLNEWLVHAGLDAAASTRTTLRLDYARAVWRVWTSEAGRALSEAERCDVSEELYRRVGALERSVESLFVRRFFDTLLTSAVLSPAFSLADANGQPCDGSQSEASDDPLSVDQCSHAGRMWTWLREHVTRSAQALAAWNLSVQSTATHVLQWMPDHVGIAFDILLLAIETIQAPDSTDLSVPPLRYLLLMVCCDHAGRQHLRQRGCRWTKHDNPSMTGEVDWQDMLEAVSASKRSGPPWSHEAAITVGSQALTVKAPPELTLLWMEPGPARIEALQDWAHCMAPYDGRLARRAVALVEHDGDPHAVTEFVIAAIRSPWHSRLDNPLGPIVWGCETDIDYPATLADVEALLLEDSERHTPLDIEAKLQPGGTYSAAIGPEFLTQVFKIPGGLALGNAASADGFAAADIEHATCILDQPSDHLAADLVTATIILYRSAAQDAGGALSFEALGDRFIHALSRELERDQDDNTFCAAVLERCLLTHSKVAILRLASDELRTLTPTRVTWLSWRLFQWWWDRLRMSPNQRRQDALRWLLKSDPGANPNRRLAGVLLDPDNMGPGAWNHRAASLLWALIGARHLITAVDRLGPDQALASDALEQFLRELSRRPLTDTEQELRLLGAAVSPLGWQGPVAIADLAVEAMLRTAPGSLSRTPLALRQRWYQTYFAGPGGEEGALPSVLDAVVRAFVGEGLDPVLEANAPPSDHRPDV